DVPFNWVGATSPATFRLQPNKSSVGNPEAAVAVCETFRLEVHDLDIAPRVAQVLGDKAAMSMVRLVFAA
ncbi:hypothetical protein, partial [Massilia sp. TWR1-2-2]|uniref:hypothetical protein n=1 Tax=Massilia sp. TWR1-2-2 TaxID=2804584 RepID=UPI003CF34803